MAETIEEGIQICLEAHDQSCSVGFWCREVMIAERHPVHLSKNMFYRDLIRSLPDHMTWITCGNMVST